jgi:hypothetical protein
MDNISNDEVMALVKKERVPETNIFIGAIKPDEKLLREPMGGEIDFFKENPHVGGMMTQEDYMVALNPHSKLSDAEKQQVMRNELARVIMHRTKVPEYEITPEQQYHFSTMNKGRSYGGPEDIRATILARIATGDSSALNATSEQMKYAKQLKDAVEQYLSGIK